MKKIMINFCLISTVLLGTLILSSCTNKTTKTQTQTKATTPIPTTTTKDETQESPQIPSGTTASLKASFSIEYLAIEGCLNSFKIKSYNNDLDSSNLDEDIVNNSRKTISMMENNHFTYCIVKEGDKYYFDHLNGKHTEILKGEGTAFHQGKYLLSKTINHEDGISCSEFFILDPLEDKVTSSVECTKNETQQPPQIPSVTIASLKGSFSIEYLAIEGCLNSFKIKSYNNDLDSSNLDEDIINNIRGTFSIMENNHLTYCIVKEGDKYYFDNLNGKHTEILQGKETAFHQGKYLLSKTISNEDGISCSEFFILDPLEDKLTNSLECTKPNP